LQRNACASAKEIIMSKLIALTTLVGALLVTVPADAAPKMSFGACKTKVTQDPRNLDGTNRNYCGSSCMVKVRECMRGG
jgi:hypothetical protein